MHVHETVRIEGSRIWAAVILFHCDIHLNDRSSSRGVGVRQSLIRGRRRADAQQPENRAKSMPTSLSVCRRARNLLSLTLIFSSPKTVRSRGVLLIRGTLRPEPEQYETLDQTLKHAALETTQGQIDGFFSQSPFKRYLLWEFDLRFALGLPSCTRF